MDLFQRILLMDWFKPISYCFNITKNQFQSHFGWRCEKMRHLLLALVLCLFSTPTFSRADFIQEYILSEMPFEVAFDNYGFTEDEWIGRRDNYTTAKLCRRAYIGRFN